MYPRRLNLNTPNNIRELGGYMRNDKKITKYKQFLRSDAITNLNKDDIDFLIDYGVKIVIDLRSLEEVSKYPNSFENIKYIKYVNLPIFDGIPNRENSSEYIPLEEFYIEILEFSKNIKNVFNLIANNKDDLILFHCTAGKDRTGIISALILMLAKIDNCDIISDYEVSYTYVKSLFEKMKKENKDIPKHTMLSKSKYIENLINYINNKYGSAEKYLIKKGVSPENLDLIKNKII